MQLDAKIPEGPLAEKWDRRRFKNRQVNPANKRKYEILVVGTGLAGASAAASLGELGYNVKAFCIQDSPRRAHSIAAQGGINAAQRTMNPSVQITYMLEYTWIGGDHGSDHPLSRGRDRSKAEICRGVIRNVGEQSCRGPHPQEDLEPLARKYHSPCRRVVRLS